MHANFFLIIFTMDCKNYLTKDKIASIINLDKAQRPVREIFKIVGVTARSVQRWIKKFHDNDGRVETLNTIRGQEGDTTCHLALELLSAVRLTVIPT